MDKKISIKVLRYTLFCICMNTLIMCKSFNTSYPQIESIHVKYLKGDIESPTIFNPQRISQFNSRLLKDTIIDNKKTLTSITQLIGRLKKQKNDSFLYSCDIRIHCNVQYTNKEVLNLYLGTSNCIIIKDNETSTNDTLIYLIRKEIGYYNYFSKEELSLFKELSTFELPKNYKDLSKNKGSLPPLSNDKENQ